MTCSTSSSHRAAAALLCALVLGPACAGPGRLRASAPARIAVFPPGNVSGESAPTRELQAALLAALRARQLSLVEPAPLEEFLARHRVRWTGGVDRETALAAGAELGADAVLITSVELYKADPPRLGLTLRLVSTGDDPAILWIDGTARAGD